MSDRKGFALHRASRRALAALAALAMTLLGAAAHAGGVVTVYSADGLRDGQPNWFDAMFAQFTRRSGIRVQYVEAGSGVIANRVLAERAAPQADVLVTLPPFMQRVAAAGALAPAPLTADLRKALGAAAGVGPWLPLAEDYSGWIYDARALPAPPASYAALLSPALRNRLQYSTPGQAGDGTAVMLLAFHTFGGRDGGFDYLRRLQANDLGPSASTGRLTALVDKGEIWIANGDMQMFYAQSRANPNVRFFVPAAADGRRYSMALPYQIALVAGAPHAAAGRALIAFLLERQAQQRLYDLAGSFPARNDVPAAGPAAAALKRMLAGVEIWTPDWNAVARELNADVERWHRITGN
ncbi:MAG: 2-aminoethylphosphonate ABC transporter substrate-binding protein [Gammaproteobacteria bacterium]|nr:2-aminoethylphosphonate ABC transporter substrate-binding protein [Gammaproteobacteria bacterium]